MKIILPVATILIASLIPAAADADEPITPQSLVADARAAILQVDDAQGQVMLDEGALVIDVREPAEFAAGHLPGAINIPRGVLEFRIGDQFASDDEGEVLDRDRPILVYCRSGGRSALATQSLVALGYTGAVSLERGFRGWTEAERQVVMPEAEEQD